MAEQERLLAEKDKAIAGHSKAMAEKDAQLAALRDALEKMNQTSK